jgi:putative protein kinase ArgK-like GTPase of G3E family
MEVPAINSTGGTYAPSSTYTGAALQASSVAAIDLSAAGAGSMSVTVASQVNMVFAQMTQGGGIDAQTLKALIMLLLIQLLMNDGQSDQSQHTLDSLAQAFDAAGNSEMTMVAVQASSMIQMQFGGAGDASAVSIEAGAAASLDIQA